MTQQLCSLLFPNVLKTYVHTQKNLHMNVYSSCVHNCQNLEAKWVSKLWYIYTMDYFSTIKRNEVSNQDKTWRDIKSMFLLT